MRGTSDRVREEENSMEQKKSGVFKLVENVKPLPAGVLADFQREMDEKTVPAIRREVEKRRLLAAQSRQRQLEMPAVTDPEQPKK